MMQDPIVVQLVNGTLLLGTLVADVDGVVTLVRAVVVRICSDNAKTVSVGFIPIAPLAADPFKVEYSVREVDVAARYLPAKAVKDRWREFTSGVVLAIGNGLS